MKKLLGIFIGSWLALSAVPAFANCSYTANAPALQQGTGPCSMDLNGNLRVISSGSGGSAGSVTAAGVNGTVAQAVQGINGGVPLPVVQSDVTASNSLNLTSTSNVLVLPIAQGQSTLTLGLVGLTGSGATVVFEVLGNNTGTIWSQVAYTNASGSVGSISLAATDISGIRFNVAGYQSFRVRVSTAGTGSVTVNSNITTGISLVGLSPGANTIGIVGVAGALFTPIHVTGTTSATAGVSSTVVAASTVTRGIVLQNTCSTAEWFSSSVAAGTALTATNSMTLAAGASFTTPDWYPISGAWTIASATAAACTYVADYK